MIAREGKKLVLIAHVTAGASGARTVRAFLAWRAIEDLRMERVIGERRAAWLELHAGAAVH